MALFSALWTFGRGFGAGPKTVHCCSEKHCQIVNLSHAMSIFPPFSCFSSSSPGFRRKGLLEAERGVAVVRAPGRRAEVPAADPGNAETSRSRLHRKIGWMDDVQKAPLPRGVAANDMEVLPLLG